ncbi:MAG: hypothetical protein JSS66_02110 [Armatimonadetes bacterium]|nr:hypothetical protein [Armatimonadota bacterium]
MSASPATWVALATLLLLQLTIAKEARDKRDQGGVAPRPFDAYTVLSVLLLVMGVVAALGVLKLPDEPAYVPSLGWFLAAWGFSSLLLDYNDALLPATAGVAAAVVAVLLGLFSAEVVKDPASVMAMTAGFGVSAAAMAVRGRGVAPMALTLVAAFGFIVTFMGEKGPGAQAVEAGSLVLTAASVAALVSTMVHLLMSRSGKGFPQVGAPVLFGLVASLLCTKVLNEPDANVIIGIVVLVAVVTHFMAPAEGPVPPWSALVSALSWIAVATLSFSFLHGYGMALAALLAVCSGLLMGDRRVLAYASPLLALSLYRFARTQYSDLTSSLDLGQHYALVGFLCGLLFVPLVLDAFGLVEKGSRSKAWAGAAVLAAMLACSVAGVVMFLGVKGMSGLLVGFGFSPLVSVLLPNSRQNAPAYAIGLGGFTLALLPLALTTEGMDRALRQQVLIGVGIVVLLGSVVVALLARQKQSEQPS